MPGVHAPTREGRSWPTGCPIRRAILGTTLAKLQDMLDEVVRHAREDVGKVDEPKAQALFETTAEVCAGLTKAYAHYEQRSEAAWQR